MSARKSVSTAAGKPSSAGGIALPPINKDCRPSSQRSRNEALPVPELYHASDTGSVTQQPPERLSGAHFQDARAPQRSVELPQRNTEQPSGALDQRVGACHRKVRPLGGLRRRRCGRRRVRDHPEPRCGRRRYYFVVQNSGHDRLLRRMSNGHNGIRCPSETAWSRSLQTAWAEKAQLKAMRRRTVRDETEAGYRSGPSLELMLPSPPPGRSTCGLPHNWRASRNTEPDRAVIRTPLVEFRHFTAYPGPQKMQGRKPLGLNP